MDDQIFQAMLGTAMPADGPPSSAMANELRGQRDLGQLLSIAPGMEKTGQNMQTGALAQAKQIGDRRQQGLTRTRQMERDKLADDRYETEEKRKDAALKLDADILKYERGGWTDIEERADSQGNVALYGLMDGRGALQKIPDSDGLKERDPYADRMAAKAAAGSPKRLNIEGTNLEYLRYPNGMIVYGTKEYPSMAAFAADRPDILSEGYAAQADEKYAIEEGSKLGQGVGQEVTDLRTGTAQQNASYGSSEGNMRGIINAIDQGANPGQIYAMFPTITNATSLLESLVSQETLGLLNKYQLKPVSDADMAVLKQVASPEMDGPALKAWAENKIQVLKRAQASGRVFEEWVSNNAEVPRGEKLDALREQMTAAADAVGPAPGEVNLGEEGVVDATADEGAMDQERAALQAELDALLAEEAAANPPASPLSKTLNAQGVP